MILILNLGFTSSAACSVCIPGTYSVCGQSSCTTCDTGTYSTKTGATSSAECGFVLKIFEFQAPYLLDEVTENIKSRISLAVSNVLGIPARNVVLAVSTYLAFRRQQSKVLVSVGILDYQGSVANYASKLTQEKLNIEMVALGLKSVQVLITGMINIHDHFMRTQSIRTSRNLIRR
jgi:hypothetical protein